MKKRIKTYEVTWFHGTHCQAAAVGVGDVALLSDGVEEKWHWRKGGDELVGNVVVEVAALERGMTHVDASVIFSWCDEEVLVTVTSEELYINRWYYQWSDNAVMRR